MAAHCSERGKTRLPELGRPIDDNRLGILRDLLILRGCLNVTPQEAAGYWVAAMHSREMAAAERLLPHLELPVVLATVVLRGAEKDCDGVDEHLRRLVRSHRPEVGIPLWYARTFDPDEDERAQALWEVVHEEAGRVLVDLPLSDLAVQRAAELLTDPSEDVQEWTQQIIAFGHKRCDAGETIALASCSDLAVTALYGADRRSTEACREFLRIAPPLGLAVAVLRYMRQQIVEVTGDARCKTLELLPSPPIAILPEARMFVRMGPLRHEGMGRLLQEYAPAVKTWFDLRLPHNRFEDWNGPEVLQYVRALVETVPDVKVVWTGFECMI
jgi:hypothetical protein